MFPTSGGTHIPTLRDWCILLVEDEFLIALDLWQLFDDEGCRVLGPAPTVAEALRILATEPRPDAAVLDVNLHGTRSEPVAAELVARGIPFVVATAYPSLPEPAFDGAPVLSKPYAMDQVCETVLRLLGGSG
jgi:CheY-like chemotaxis protein